MIRLTPMNETEFQMYLSTAIAEYAQDHIEAGTRTPENALSLATQQYQELLPNGLSSENNYFFSIQDEVMKTNVGMLWFAVVERGGKTGAFVYDVKIHEAFRRRGYGEQAFQALETKVRELGLHTIALHVFGHNHAARAMYEKLGYVTTNVQMLKTL